MNDSKSFTNFYFILFLYCVFLFYLKILMFSILVIHVFFYGSKRNSHLKLLITENVNFFVGCHVSGRRRESWAGGIRKAPVLKFLRVC